MISVGVDIDRLGLMVVMGQPQSTSEYIQATSRVGRRYPGLVVTLFNAARSRDRSHYESFVSYHSALYRQVESTSVTPFSPRARDRGLHAVLIALARLTIPGLADNAAADAVAHHEKELDVLVGADPRAGRERSIREAVEATGGRARRGSSTHWRDARDRERRRPRASTTPDIDKTLLVDAADEADAQVDTLPTLWSLRDVDQESNLYLVTDTDVPAVKGAVRTKSARHDLRRRIASSRSGTSPSWSPASTAGVSATRTCTSRGSSASSASAASSCRRRATAARHPGRPVPALALVSEVQSPRRPPTPRRASTRTVCGDCNRRSSRRGSSMVCPRGHIDDFPYMRWVHEGTPGGRRAHDAEHRGARRDRLAARHRDQRAAAARKRTMDKAFDRFALRDVTRASATDPGSGDEQEDVRPAGSHAAARRLERLVREPPLRDLDPALVGRAFQLLDKHWDILRALPAVRSSRRSSDLELTAGTTFTTEDLVEAVAERKRDRRATRARPRGGDSTRRVPRAAAQDRRTCPEASSPHTRTRSPASLERRDLQGDARYPAARGPRARRASAESSPRARPETLAPLFATRPGLASRDRGHGARECFSSSTPRRSRAGRRSDNVVEQNRNARRPLRARAPSAGASSPTATSRRDSSSSTPSRTH